MAYKPLKITGMSTGLIQQREEFILPDDAYPVLNNAYVWRERIKRKRGFQLLGRLQRNFSALPIGNSANPWTINIYTYVTKQANEINAAIVPGSLDIFVGASTLTNTITGYTASSKGCRIETPSTAGMVVGQIVTISGVVAQNPNLINGTWTVTTVSDATHFRIDLDNDKLGKYVSGGTWSIQLAGTTINDNGDGTLSSTPAGVTGTINYNTGVIVANGASAGLASTMNISYYPNLPVMGLRTREIQDIDSDQMIAFDQNYAYQFNGASNTFQQFPPQLITALGPIVTAPFTWNAAQKDISGNNFFWSTNYWIGGTGTPFPVDGTKLFWVANGRQPYDTVADPPRITDGQYWLNFYNDADTTISKWAQIDATTWLTNFLCMLPFRGRMVVFNTWEGTNASASVNYFNRIRWATIGNPFIDYDNGPPSKGSWRDDIRGQGGFLDIPTSEDIISVGFVRDNVVIYCERSTWQLRYTGRSIAPFQVERVNSELGAEGTFSSIQFDTSLVGVGNRGVVECDSYASKRIDIKIPDFVFEISSVNNGETRVHGIRDFPNRLAFWTIPLASIYDPNVDSTNYIFPNTRLVYNYENNSWALFSDSLTCLGTFQLQISRTWADTPIPWIQCNFPWIEDVSQDPIIVGGNQQGFVLQLDQLTVNDVSLYIQNIIGNASTNTATVIVSPAHNLTTDMIIGIKGIPAGDPFASLNGQVFQIITGEGSNPPVNPQDQFQIFKYNPASQKFDIPQTNASGTFKGVGLIYTVENFSIKSKKFNFLDEGQNIQMGFLDILMPSSGKFDGPNAGALSLNVYLDYDDNTPSNTLPENQTPDTFFNTVIPTTNAIYSNIEGSKFWQRVYCATRASFLTLEYTFSNAQMASVQQQLNIQIDAQVLWVRRAGRMTQG